MSLITVKDVMEWGPCDDYPEPRVRWLLGDGARPVDIADLRRFRAVEPEDRVWLLQHVLYPSEAWAFCSWCARAVFLLWEEPVPASLGKALRGSSPPPKAPEGISFRSQEEALAAEGAWDCDVYDSFYYSRGAISDAAWDAARHEGVATVRELVARSDSAGVAFAHRAMRKLREILRARERQS